MLCYHHLTDSIHSFHPTNQDCVFEPWVPAFQWACLLKLATQAAVEREIPPYPTAAAAARLQWIGFKHFRNCLMIGEASSARHCTQSVVGIFGVSGRVTTSRRNKASSCEAQ
jgi:hypothetical protein